MLRAPILRVALALIFATPAAVADMPLVHGVTGEAVPPLVWRQIVCLAGRMCRRGRRDTVGNIR